MSVDKELLEAIGQMMDHKLQPISKRLDFLEQNQKSLEQGQKEQSEFERGTRVLVEGIGKNIKLLAEAHGANASKLQQLDRMEMTVNDVKSDTEVIKDVVSWHSGDLQRLKKA